MAPVALNAVWHLRAVRSPIDVSVADGAGGLAAAAGGGGLQHAAPMPFPLRVSSRACCRTI